jgi:hypothetical protein
LKSLLLSVLLFAGVHLIKAQNNEFLLFGGEKNDFGLALINSYSSEGIMLLASTRSFGSGSSDFLLMQFNAELDLVKQQCFGGVHHDLPKSLIKGNDNEYILFGSSFDFESEKVDFNLTRVDSAGDFLSRRIIQRKNADIGKKIIRCSDGNYVCVGMASGKNSFGQSKFFKISPEGEILIEKDFGENAIRDYGFDVLENEKGFLMLSTNNCEIELSAAFGVAKAPSDITVLQLDHEGRQLWEYNYRGDDYDYAYSFVETEEAIFIAMNTRSEQAKSFDIRILKLDLSGVLVDSYDFGGADFEYAYRIIEDANSDLLVCGSSASDVEQPSFYAFKINQGGELLWTRTISKNASIYAYDVVERENGNFLFTGKYAYSESNSDIFLLELTSQGESILQNR